MTYTADFSTIRKPGDMFQSINGDVWMVVKVHGALNLLQRQTVKRIWIYSSK